MYNIPGKSSREGRLSFFYAANYFTEATKTMIHWINDPRFHGSGAYTRANIPSDRTKEWKNIFRTIIPQGGPHRKGNPNDEEKKKQSSHADEAYREKSEFRDIHGSSAYRAHFDEKSAYRARERTTPLNGGFHRGWLSSPFRRKTHNPHNSRHGQNHCTIGGLQNKCRTQNPHNRF